MGILDILTSQLGNTSVLNQMGKPVDADPGQVMQVVALGLPTLMEALKRNASTPKGEKALENALGKHEVNDVGDIKGILKTVDTEDGKKILGHVFSDKEERVQGNIAKKTGLDVGQVVGILVQLAPIVMAFIANRKKAKENPEEGGVSGLLGSLTGAIGQSSGGAGLLGLASQFLDSDQDGDVTDDIGNLIGSFMKK
jgi:hypothetical protein